MLFPNKNNNSQKDPKQVDSLPPLPDISSSNHRRRQQHHHHRRLATAAAAVHGGTTTRPTDDNTRSVSEPFVVAAAAAASSRKTHRRAYSEGAATYLLVSQAEHASLSSSASFTEDGEAVAARRGSTGGGSGENNDMNHGRFEDFYVLTRPVRFVAAAAIVIYILDATEFAHSLTFTFAFLAQIFQCDHSAIWECVHRVSGQRYCVKIMNSQTQEAANEAVMFHAAQSHDNILSLVAIMEDEVEKKLYLISELMAGGNLLSRVVQEDGRLDTTTSNERQVQRLALQLLLGVQHLHETACVTHNDLNPANILLDTDDSLRIADFGSAEPIEYPSSSSAESSVIGPSTTGTTTAGSSTLESSSNGGIHNNHGNNNNSNSNSSSIQAVSSSKCYRAPGTAATWGTIDIVQRSRHVERGCHSLLLPLWTGQLAHARVAD